MVRFDIPDLYISTSDHALLVRRDYTIGRGLARGQYGVVYRATHYDEPCAAKVINLASLNESMRTKFLPREVYIMQTLCHPHLVQVLDIFAVANDTKLIIFMELLDGGNLAQLVRRPGTGAGAAIPLSEERTAKFYAQFGDAIRYMHSLGYAHRDIKLENLLLDHSQCTVKVIDFGFSRPFFNQTEGNEVLCNTSCGTARYIAPEVITNTAGYDATKADVWSVGVVLYCLLTGAYPFGGEPLFGGACPNGASPRESSSLYLARLIAQQHSLVLRFESAGLSAQAQQFVRHHLQTKVHLRGSMSTLLNDPWVKKWNIKDQIDRTM